MEFDVNQPILSTQIDYKRCTFFRTMAPVQNGNRRTRKTSVFDRINAKTILRKNQNDGSRIEDGQRRIYVQKEMPAGLT
jgi:hypothetical protein